MDDLKRTATKLEYDFERRHGVFYYPGTPGKELPIPPARLLAIFRGIDPEVRQISTRCFIGNTMYPNWEGRDWRNAHGEVKFDKATFALVEDER